MSTEEGLGGLPGTSEKLSVTDSRVVTEELVGLVSNPGSDSEEESNNVDDLGVPLRRNRHALEFPAFLDPDDLGDLADEVLVVDASEDAALAGIVEDPDLLHFDWKSNAAHFEGVRETFSAPSGPTFPMQGQTPLQIFKKIWDDEVLDIIVRESNRYAHQLRLNKDLKPSSRLHLWKEVTKDEIWTFFSILMLQSLVFNPVEEEYWYPKYPYLRIGSFTDIMACKRFLLIKKCLHFVDNSTLSRPVQKLDKIQPIVDHLNHKFQTLYLPEQIIALDESLLLWKGKLSFAQLISYKKAKIGIKSYELCESKSGYLWAMGIYTGKGEMGNSDTSGSQYKPQEATGQIVLNLMRPLLNKGYTLVMDNFYNSPLLSRVLKVQYKTDTLGTLRLNRMFVPDTLKGKQKSHFRPGEVKFSCTKDLNVLAWRDSSLVSMISTYHTIEIDGREKYGYYKYKPKVALDYNLQMGGVDKKDQLLSAFPVERTRNAVWYKKLFRRLLNVSIHNAYIIYGHQRKISNREFRMQLADEILAEHKGHLPLMKPPPPRSINGHYPVKNERQQRCKHCALANKRKSTIFRCSACTVNLCVDGCFAQYHHLMLNSDN